jgi:shikimate dehydrogenase
VSDPKCGVVGNGARRFIEAEIGAIGRSGGAAPVGPLVAHDPDGEVSGLSVNVAAIGTTAAEAVGGDLLGQAIVDRGFDIASAVTRTTPEALFDDRVWQLGVVLSPWKQEIGQRCAALAPSADATGVVDTVVRTAIGTVGFNTNTWAAMSALEELNGGSAPTHLLLLGAGASGRSVALAVARAWPGCELVVADRSRSSAEQLVQGFGGRLLDDLTHRGAWRATPTVVVNATTWGETEASESEPFAIDLEGVFGPGRRFFDLNDRVSALQNQALAAGCTVMSGSLMQRVTNACRAEVLLYANHD